MRMTLPAPPRPPTVRCAGPTIWGAAQDGGVFDEPAVSAGRALRGVQPRRGRTGRSRPSTARPGARRLLWSATLDGVGGGGIAVGEGVVVIGVQTPSRVEAGGIRRGGHRELLGEFRRRVSRCG